jgi:hypothetical protein
MGASPRWHWCPAPCSCDPSGLDAATRTNGGHSMLLRPSCRMFWQCKPASTHGIKASLAKLKLAYAAWTLPYPIAPPLKASLMQACSYGAQIPFQLKIRPGACENLPRGACLFLLETNLYSIPETPSAWAAKARVPKTGEYKAVHS